VRTETSEDSKSAKKGGRGGKGSQTQGKSVECWEKKRNPQIPHTIAHFWGATFRKSYWKAGCWGNESNRSARKNNSHAASFRGKRKGRRAGSTKAARLESDHRGKEAKSTRHSGNKRLKRIEQGTCHAVEGVGKGRG